MEKTILFTIILSLFLSSNAQPWEEKAKIVASDRTSLARFGHAVSISGNYAIVGTYLDGTDASGGNPLNQSGSAYIYERNTTGSWIEVQKIVASDRADRDWFATSLAIDGNYAIVGSPRDDEDSLGGNYTLNAGSVYVFERDSMGSWNEVQKIVHSNRASGDVFGVSVAISDSYVIIGAGLHDTDLSGLNKLDEAGAAYFFKRNGNGIWNEVQKIVASDRSFKGYFGNTVAIHKNFALVGSERNNTNSSYNDTLDRAGAAYLFEKDSNEVWNQVQKIVSSDRDVFDNFGRSVAINGKHAVIGTDYESEDASGGNTLIRAGSAYIFERDVAGIWNEVQKLVATDRSIDDFFGGTVSISSDYIIVGAVHEDEDSSGANTSTQAGSAYIFKKSNTGNWNQIQKIVASDRDQYDLFGWTVSINCNKAIIGAYQEDEDPMGGNPQNKAGSAYIFESFAMITNTITHSACISYTSPSSNYIWTTSGTYQDTVKNTFGCDSILTINLTIDSVNTDVTQSAATLTASANNTTYQWLDCDNGNSAINGETNQTFTPTQNGNYAVAITENGCTDTSACYSIMTVGIDDNDFGKNLSIYPNPTKGSFTIDSGQNSEEIFVRIQNTLGQNIPFQQLRSNGSQIITFEAPSGIYLIEVFTNKGASITRKILKE